MTPRDAGGVQEDLHVGVAAEHVLPFVERDAAVHPFQAEGDFAAATRGPASLGARDRLTKRVTKPVDGPNESRVRRIVADGIANLANQVGEILLDDERAGPQTLLKSLLESAFGRWATRMLSSSNALGDRCTRRPHAAAPGSPDRGRTAEAHPHRRTLP